jgi:hypothetical protein
MGTRPTSITLDTLRLTIQQIEQQTSDESVDLHSVEELKRILLNRIAELEVIEALAQPENEPAQAPLVSDLPPLLTDNPEPENPPSSQSAEPENPASVV